MSHWGTESLLSWLEINDQLPRYRYAEDHIEKALSNPSDDGLPPEA